jgi:3',5'-cyclic AMP phosphodiesterase CpdA
VWLAVALVVSGAGSVLAQEDNGPSGIHLAVGENASTAVEVSWLGPPGLEARLDIRETGQDEFERSIVAESEQPPGSAKDAYHATVDELEPDTTYEYRVEIDDSVSKTRTFETAPEPANATNVMVTAFADHGTVDPANTRADGDAPIAVTELTAELEPDLHVHPGDTSYAEGDARQWNEYVEQLEPLASQTPYMAVPGNHEREEPQGFEQYDARFETETSDDGLWYSVRYGNVIVVGLNSERACEAGTANEADDCETGEPVDPYEPQLSFVEDALASAAEDPSIDWRILASHHLFYSSSEHAGAIGLKDHYMPLVDEYGVDVVVQGHDHVYERSKPLQEREVTTNGTVYLTNGAAGAGHYEFSDDRPTWSAYRDNEHYGTLVLALGNDTLEGRFVTLEDGTIDAFTVENVDEGVRYVNATDGASDNLVGDTVNPSPVWGALPLVTAVGLAIATRRSRRET